MEMTTIIRIVAGVLAILALCTIVYRRKRNSA